jgi:C_GCAxxG_C_C family probable redox protein
MPRPKEDIIQRAHALGFKYETEITGCCQCTIAAIQDALQVRDDTVFKSASGLTAGGGLTCQSSCGGYIGGVMVMSSIFGRRRETWNDDKEDKNCSYAMAKALMDRFDQEYGTHLCKDIHRKIFGRTFDLRDTEQRAAFEELGAHVDKCVNVVGKAAAWATELVLEELSHRGLDLESLRVP